MCVSGTPEGYKSEAGRGEAVCYAVSNARGGFVFEAVPPGDYVLVSHFHSNTTRYEVTPTTLKVTVLHKDLSLPNPFKVNR